MCIGREFKECLFRRPDLKRYIWIHGLCMYAYKFFVNLFLPPSLLPFVSLFHASEGVGRCRMEGINGEKGASVIFSAIKIKKIFY